MTFFRTLSLALLATFAIAALPSGQARADGAIVGLLTAQDKARLSRFDATRAAAVSAAKSAGAPADVTILDGVLSGKLLSVRSADLTGDWRCRTLKLGKSAGLVVYGWFRCRIVDDGAGWRLDKLTGSQRVSGRFYDDGETRMIFAGALSLGDEPRQAYGRPGARNQVAVAVRPGPDRLRLEFPEPEFESAFDVMELERVPRARK
ncbi:MAG: DUF4893 domain-containing protein [Phenylobacterium sp.]